MHMLTRRATVLFSPGDYKMVAQAAAAAGKPFSEFAREAAIAQAFRDQHGGLDPMEEFLSYADPPSQPGLRVEDWPQVHARYEDEIATPTDGPQP
jgi:hypothetical protein